MPAPASLTRGFAGLKILCAEVAIALDAGVDADPLSRSRKHGCSQEVVAWWFKRWQKGCDRCPRAARFQPKNRRHEEPFVQPDQFEGAQARLDTEERRSEGWDTKACHVSQVGRYKASGPEHPNIGPQESWFAQVCTQTHQGSECTAGGGKTGYNSGEVNR